MGEVASKILQTQKGRRKKLRGDAYIFSNGSLLESDNSDDNNNIAGGRAFTVRADSVESKVRCEIGSMVTVWDSEVASMAGGLAKVR